MVGSLREKHELTPVRFTANKAQIWSWDVYKGKSFLILHFPFPVTEFKSYKSKQKCSAEPLSPASRIACPDLPLIVWVIPALCVFVRFDVPVCKKEFAR